MGTGTTFAVGHVRPVPCLSFPTGSSSPDCLKEGCSASMGNEVRLNSTSPTELAAACFDPRRTGFNKKPNPGGNGFRGKGEKNKSMGTGHGLASPWAGTQMGWGPRVVPLASVLPSPSFPKEYGQEFGLLPPPPCLAAESSLRHNAAAGGTRWGGSPPNPQGSPTPPRAGEPQLLHRTLNQPRAPHGDSGLSGPRDPPPHVGYWGGGMEV